MAKIDNKNHLSAADVLEHMLEPIPKNALFRFETQHKGKVPPTWGPPRRALDRHRLYWVSDGAGEHWIEGLRVPMKPGWLVWAGPGVLLGSSCDPTNPPYFTVIHFNTVHRVTKEPIPLLNGRHYCSYIPTRKDWYESMFTDLYREILDERYRGSKLNAAGAFLHAIISQVVHDIREVEGGGVYDIRIKQVRQYMNENPLERLTVRNLAKKAGLSERYFVGLFKKQTGMTPKSYQVQVRLRYAAFLIHFQGMNISETAHACGFSDPFVFSRQFKSLYGYSPSEPLRKGT